VEQVLWIGGPPASGKTTVARSLARRYGPRLYSADTRTWVHRDRALDAGNAAAQRWESMAPSARWENLTPEALFEMSLHHERGPMVIDDLRALPESPMIIAEGSPLPASVVTSGIATRAHAVWLLPTEEFQDATLAAAGTTGGPAVLYRHLREVIAREARDHDVPVLTVDGARNASQVVSEVEQMFAAALQAGGCARTLAERQLLLREINDAVVDQVRGYFARPWAVGDANTVVTRFVCECGDPGCDVDRELAVGDLPAHRAGGPRHMPRTGTRMNE
jgi:hypothetical protein